MARRPKIWIALGSFTMGAAVLLVASASPGLTDAGGTAVVIPLATLDWSRQVPRKARRQSPRPSPSLTLPLKPAAVAPIGDDETEAEAPPHPADPAETAVRERTDQDEAPRSLKDTPQLVENHPAASEENRNSRTAAAERDSGADAGLSFVLAAVEIEGATAYDPDELLPLYQDLLGQEIALDAVFALADAITAHYRNDGYTLSQAIVPPQTIRAGVVRITVIEGFIDKVLVEGETRGRAGLFRAWGEKIKASRPFNAAVLERYTLLANDLPGASVRAVLRPSETTPGAAEVVFEVTHQSLQASASVDNRAPKTTGPRQATVSLSVNSLLGLYDRTTLTVNSAQKRDRSQFIGIRHDQVLGSEGATLSLSASHSISEPGDVLKDLDLISKSTVLGIDLAYPVIRSRATGLTLSGGFTYREVKSDAVSARLFRDRLSVVSLGGSARFDDPWGGRDAVEIRVHKGLNILNASANDDPLLTRADGSGDFTKITGSLARTQHLGGGLSLYLAATGQYASSQLLASEEFAFGGANFGRAYDPSELTGDHGAAVAAEIRYTDQPDIPILNFYQLYGFVDLGTTFDIGANETDSKRSGASAGLGLRFGVTDHLSGQLELAKPMTRPVALEDNGKSARLFFRLSARF